MSPHPSEQRYSTSRLFSRAELLERNHITFCTETMWAGSESIADLGSAFCFVFFCTHALLIYDAARRSTPNAWQEIEFYDLSRFIERRVGGEKGVENQETTNLLWQTPREDQYPLLKACVVKYK